MNSVQVLPAVNYGFSQSCIDKMNNYVTSKVILIDSTFYKEYLNFIKGMSVQDAKQLIYIYKFRLNQPVNFYYRSDEDILMELTTIVGELQNPNYQLQELFKAKIQYMLPISLHQWIENDLSAMLFFVEKALNSLTNKAFRGGEELKSYFMNFIQFNVIQHMDGLTTYTPIEFTNSFNLTRWIGEYEKYKKWYSSVITPKKSYKWLEKCEDEQLDSLLDNLAQKKLLILHDVFYPQTSEDKVALLIASINCVPINETICYKKLFPDEPIQLTIESKKFFKGKTYDGCFIFEEDIFNINFDKEKYKGIGLRTGNYSPTFELQLDAGYYDGAMVGKLDKEIIMQGREYFINQLKNTVRKQKARAIEVVSKEERTVSILKKNMPKLEELAQAQKMTLNQLTNKLIEVAYESKNPD